MGSETCRRLRRLACLLAVVLALAAQLSAGALRSEAFAEARSDQLTNALAGAMVMCQASDRGHSAPVHHRHRPDQGIPGILACSGQALALLHDPYLAATPTVMAAARATLYSARAPPSLPLPSSYPRGPPSLV